MQTKLLTVPITLSLRIFAQKTVCKMIPYGNTFHYGTGDSALDLCMTDKSQKIISFKKTDAPFINGHDLIQITIDVKPFKVKPKFIHTRDYNKLKKSNYITRLNSINWNELLKERSIDIVLDKFYSSVFEVIDSIAPIKKVKVNNCHRGPWITDLIKNLQLETKQSYLKFRRIRSDENYIAWKDSQRRLQIEIDCAFENYQRERILKCPSDQMHKELQNLGLITKNSDLNIKHCADELIVAFTDVSNDATIEPIEKVLTELNEIEQPDVLKFDFVPVTDAEIVRVVNSFTSNAVGIDGMSLRLIKLCLNPLLEFFKEFFNRSLTEKIYPRIFKKSIIIPVNKIKVPQSTNDYRPISIQCCLAKVLDKIVYNQIEKYVNLRNLRDPFQSAYRPNHSTQTALVKLISDAKKSLDCRQLTLVVLFDYSKCFDKISRRILIIYLYQMGFSIEFVTWLISYLSERLQAIKKENGTFTEWLLTNLGLPQGSVLVTIFFPLYVLVIALSILFCKFLRFSDDMQIYTSFKKEEVDRVFLEVNRDIVRVKEWSNNNSMILNLDKTEAILIGHPRILNSIDCGELPELTDGVNKIKFKKSVKILGVMIDNNLTFKEHIAKVCAKVNGKFQQLYNFRRITDKHIRVKLVNSIITPILDYALVATLGISDEMELKLQRLQNKCVRYIIGLPRDAHITVHRRELKWLNIRDRRQYFALCMLYNAHTLKQPQYIYDLLKYNTSARPFRAASNSGCNTFQIPSFKTDIYKNAFPVAAVRTWNSLPIEIIQSPSLDSFKVRVRKFLFENEPINLPESRI